MIARAARIAIACAVLLAPIGARPGAAQEPVLPFGMTASTDLSGIYAGANADDCCWLSDVGTLNLTPPVDASAIVLDVFIPNFALTSGPQRLFVALGNGDEQQSEALAAGEHELLYPLPASTSPAPLELRIRSSYTFVPAQLGMNLDPRHLSVLVRGVHYYTASQGLELPPSAPPVIVAFALEKTGLSSGDAVEGTITTSSNVVRVDARIANFHLPVPTGADGHFTLHYTVPHIPFFFRGTHDLIVTAYNAAGLAAQQTVPLKLR